MEAAFNPFSYSKVCRFFQNGVRDSRSTSKHLFLGTFRLSELPKRVVNYPSLLAVDISEDQNVYHHWVVIYLDDNKKAEYFDMYGAIPPLPIVQWMSGHSDSWRLASLEPVTELMYDFTIAFAIFVINKRPEAKHLVTFMSNFSKRTHASNERTLELYVRSLVPLSAK